MDSSASVAKRSVVAGSDFSCKVRFSICFSMVLGARWFCVGMLAILLTLSRGCGTVNGITFTFNGFAGFSDVLTVLNSAWNYRADNGSFYLDAPDNYLFGSVTGRFMYPELVQMTDPNTKTVKSFSTTFIYQILVSPGEYGLATGSGMAFIMVPDNITLGANSDNMGLLTVNTTATLKNYDSDNHTLGVELDTHMNPEFGDPNDNHIGIDLASMNSTYWFMPVITLTTPNTEVFQQVWIDYFQADSRMDIYITRYGQGKPATPQGTKSGLDLSFLKEYMYIGFSAATGIGCLNDHIVLAWSFSNEGDASPIKIARDVSPGSSPPPPASSSRPPPPSGPVAPSPNPPPNVLQAPPPPASHPPVASNPPPPGALGSPSPPSPSAPPPISGPPPGPSNSTSPANFPVKVIAGVSTVGALIVVVIGFCCWWKIRYPDSKGTATPSESGVRQNLELSASAAKTVPQLRIFISHTGGKDGSLKVFPIRLSKELMKNQRYKVFIDRGMKKGVDFTEVIKQEIRKTDLGIVVITEEFFRRKWPMLELVEFVELHKKNGVRVLPLFYMLTPDAVRSFLERQYWEDDWRKMSTEQHPIIVADYRRAVTILCNINGINYNYTDRSHEEIYTQDVLTAVQEIYNEIYPERIGS